MIKTVITPFANDTFAFAALENGLIETDVNYEISYKDLEELNQLSLKSDGDLLKISFNTLGKILDNYVLLPVGSCLGYNNGPKIISKEKFDTSELKNKKIGIPGKNTTAYMLLKILLPNAAEEIVFPYHELTNAVNDGIVDCALTIHETRFQIEEQGMLEIADIFDLWTVQTDSPLPLGGVVAKRSLGDKTINNIVNDLRKSLEMARKNEDMAMNFSLRHSFKKDIDFVKKNVDLYVNDETFQLSHQGIKSIQSLLNLGFKKNLLPKPTNNWLFN